MKSKLLFTLILIGTTLGIHAQVQIFTDDFNDNSKDGSKWGNDFDAFGAGGQLTETDGRLEYELATQTSGARVRPWIGMSPTYGQDWEAIVELNNTHTYPASINGGSSVGLAVQNPIDQSQLIYIELQTENFFGISSKGFWTDHHGSSAGWSFTNLLVNSALVRLTFDSASKVIRSYYQTAGFWVQFGSFGIAGSDGTTANANWGMSSDSQFRIGILGHTYGGNGPPADTHYADNFQLAINTQDGSQGNPSANSLVTEGRNALAAEDLATAKAKFAAAIAQEASHDQANALLAVVRLVDVVNKPEVQTFLTRLGVGALGRNVYGWNAKPAENPDGSLVVPTGVSAAEFALNWRSNAVPEVSAAIANLEQITDTGFLLSLTAAETTASSVDVDYGDVRVLRAMLHALIYFSHTMLAHDFDAQLTALDTLADAPGGFSVQQLLTDHPQLFTYATTNDLSAARAAFAAMVDEYVAGSDILRARPAGTSRLFNFATDDATAEARFRNALEALKSSLNEAAPMHFRTHHFIFFAGNHFTPGAAIRGWLPDFQGSRMIMGTTDPTFGNVFWGKVGDSYSSSSAQLPRSPAPTVVDSAMDDLEGWLFQNNSPLRDLESVPVFDQVRPPGAVPFRLRARTQTGKGYAFQSTTNFVNWETDSTFVAIDATSELRRPALAADARRFYRLVALDEPLPRPVNDDFANRTDLGTGSISVMGHTIGATTEAGEPSFSDPFTSSTSFGNTVWYSWTAPSSGTYQVQLHRPSAWKGQRGFSVFTGNSLGNLQQVASSPWGGTSLFASAGTTYQIAVLDVVNSFRPQASPGGFELAISRPPTSSMSLSGSNPTFSVGDPIEIQVNASDPDGSVRRVELSIQVNHQASSEIRLHKEPFRFIWTNAPAGDHLISATAFDDTGVREEFFNSSFITVNP